MVNALFDRCLAFLQRRNVEAYVVGGTVRDRLLGRAITDLDLAVPRDALKVSRELADELGGAFYTLDVERETGRVVMLDHTVVDVARLRGATIVDDLAVRDFTINAMALRATALESLIDPFQGARDLQSHTLRAIADQTFVLDPVRLLRALRQSHELDFQIETLTNSLMQRDRELLALVSGERVRDELVKMLQARHGTRLIGRLAEFDYLRLVLPHAQWSLPIQEAADQVHEFTSRLCANSVSATVRNAFLNPDHTHVLADYVGQPLADARTRGTLLPLAALYAAEGDVEADLRRLKYSRHEIEFVRALVRRRESFSPLALPITPLEAHRFFRDADGVGLGVICLALSPAVAGTGRSEMIERATQLLEYYIRRAELLEPRPLLDGAEIAERFQLRGPQIGAAVRALVEAQVQGLVTSRESAESFLRSMLEPHA